MLSLVFEASWRLIAFAYETTSLSSYFAALNTVLGTVKHKIPLFAPKESAKGIPLGPFHKVMPLAGTNYK
jgi:hypothetical protein